MHRPVISFRCLTTGLLLLPFLLSLLLAHALPSQAEQYSSKANTTIKVGLPAANPPWFYRDKPDKALQGLEVYLQEQLFSSLEVTPELYPYENLVRLAADMLKGVVDAGPVIRAKGLTPIVSADLSCTQHPYGASEAMLYALKDSKIQATSDIAQLKDLHIAYTRVVNIHKLFPNFPRHQLTSHRTPKHALNMLINRRAQLIMSTPETTEFWHREKDLQLKPIYKVANFEVFLCFSHTSLGEDVAKFYAAETSLNALNLLNKMLSNRTADH